MRTTTTHHDRGRRDIVPAALLICLVYVAGQLPSKCNGAAQRPEVLIYYANETEPNEAELQSWQTIISWLKSSDNPELTKIPGQLERDLEGFHKAVDEEIALLKRISIDSSTAPPMVVFTNRLVRDGNYLVLRRDVEPEEIAIQPFPSDNFILVSNPLARPEMLARALEEACSHFDPNVYDFVLVTKSHGNAEMALTPRLIVRASETTKEELLAVAAGELPEGQSPSWTKRLGITKDEYFRVLEKFGQDRNMHFSMVFMESCHGVLGKVTVRPPQNIAHMYMTGEQDTEWHNLDYEQALSQYDGTVPLWQFIEADLSQRFPRLVRGDEPFDGWWRLPWHAALWWIPLFLWLGWIVYRRRQLRRRRSQASPNCD